MNRNALPVWTLLLSLALLASACGGGGGGGGDAKRDSEDLALIDIDVAGTDGVALNQIITMEFSADVDPATVSQSTVQIRLAPNFALQVAGDLRVEGNRIVFEPRLPTSPDLSDAGFRPSSTYEIRVQGHPSANPIRNTAGDPLVDTEKVSFGTAIATSPSLFIDYFTNGSPQVSAISPDAGAEGVIRPDEVRITFDEPIHPGTVTATNVQLTMTERPPGTSLAVERPISVRFVVEQDLELVVLRLLPDFPLADNARYRVNVDRRVTDLAGNDVVAYESHFAIRDEPAEDGDFTLTFGPGSEILRDDDVTIASWNDQVPGRLSGIFTAAGGNGSDGDFAPTTNTTLDADDVTDGRFNFRKFEIPEGVTVRLVGSKPATILSLKDIRIEGTLDASGFKGVDSELASNNSVIPAAPGGSGGPGGGRGGGVETAASTRSRTLWSGVKNFNAEDGWGTERTAGWTANLATSTVARNGGGGGGGGHANDGSAGRNSTYFTSSYNGKGGAGGEADGDSDVNDMTAGGGGGSGGNGFYYWYPWHTGAASGGGGGGAVRIQSAGDLIVTGNVLAQGGDGGRATSTGIWSGGAGGGGAGGSIDLRATLDLSVDGGTVSTAGGKGGTTARYTGRGGDGSGGFVKMRDADGTPDVDGSTVVPSTYATEAFEPKGKGSPSVARTLWVNLGVFDPEFTAPASADVDTDLPKPGQTIRIEVQMAREDVFDLGNPDLDQTSEWVLLESIATLNGQGYSFLRIRVTMELTDDQIVSDPLPTLGRVRLPFTF